MTRPMTVTRAAPHPRLAPFVRHYGARTADLGDRRLRIALPARTDVLLEFYFTIPHLLELHETGRHERAPPVAAVGPQTHRRVDLILAGRLDIFTISFRPTALHAMLGVPMTDLTDAGIDGAALFGAQAMTQWQDRLAGAQGLAERARIADSFLLTRLADRGGARVNPAVAAALRRWRDRPAVRDDDTFPARRDLSPRHFRRVFEEQVGIAPKRYARIVRLEAALAAKAAAPARSWTDIAHGCGWFDQAHMDKDFRALAGAAPSRFVAHSPAE